MKQKIRTAIVGTGKASHMHAAALRKIEESELVAVCSRNTDHAKSFAASYGLQTCTNIKEMISRHEIDVAIVCTPHPYHKESTVDALEAGAHVLVEKPLASCVADCNVMIETAKCAKKILGVVSQRRFFPAVKRCKRAIDEGKIGEPMLGIILMLGWRDQAYYNADPWRGKWSTEGGGVLVNQAPHQLDLLLWFMGQEPVELYGTWKNINHPYIEVEDTAVAIVKFKNGAIANIVVSNAQKPGLYGKVHVHGSNGASVGVQTDAGAMFIAGMTDMVAPPQNDIWTIQREENFLQKFEEEDAQFFSKIDPVDYSIREQHLDFIRAIINNQQPLITGYDGRKSVELFTAIYKSMEQNDVVRWPI